MFPHLTQPLEILYQPAASLRMRPHTRNNYRHTRNIVYAEAHGVGLVMDLFQPLSPKDGMAVIDIFSGGWHSDRTMLNEHIGFGLIDALCDAGITVFAVSPGSLPLFTGLEMTGHVHAAIRHIKAHASAYTICADRLALMGVSAGGHLAALAALQPREAHSRGREVWQQHDTAVQAVAVFFPPSDLLDYNGVPIIRFKIEGLDLTRLLFRSGIADKSVAAVEARLAELSPARIISEQPPPFMIVQGKKDLVVPWEQAAKLADALQAVGGKAHLLYNEVGGHLWPGIEREIQQTVEWLTAHIAA